MNSSDDAGAASVTATLGVRRYDADDPRCEPPLDPGVPVVDPHHHLIDRDWIHYGVADLATDLTAGHQVGGSVYVECGSAYRAAGPVALRPVGETEYVVAEAARPGLPPGALAGIVARADLALGAAVAEVLDAHQAAAGSRLCGIRYSTAWRPGHDNGERVTGMFADERVHAGVAVLGPYGLPLDCWLYPHQFDEFIGIAQSFPELMFVVDHLGVPLSGVDPAERAAALALWRAGIARLAARPNIAMKLGGLTGPMLGAPWPPMSQPSSADIAEFWRPVVDHAIEAFGPARCLFESNFPIDGMVADYVTIWNAHKRLAAPYSTAERALLLGGSARSIYRLSL